MKKCSNCKAIMSLDNFRDAKNQCRQCERDIQRINRKNKKLLTGNRHDPTYLLTDLQKKAIVFLYENFNQYEIAEVFNVNQSTISNVINQAK